VYLSLFNKSLESWVTPLVEYWSIRNVLEWYERKEYYNKSERIRGTLSLGRNVKGIPRKTSIYKSFVSGNLQRKDPSKKMHNEWVAYPYDFALLDKWNLFHYSKWLLSILGNSEQLVILHSWVHEFLYNLSETEDNQSFFYSILLLTDLCIGGIGFHSPHGW